MGKRKNTAKGTETTATQECRYCNPSEADAQNLGSLIGAYRHQHYIREFPSTDDLEKHLRATSYFTPPEHGYDFDSWLASVLNWHRQKRRWMAEDEQRAKRLGVVLPESPLTTTDPVKQRQWAEAKREDQLNKRYANDLGRRTFYRTVEDCKTPEELETLARGCLSHDPAALAVQLHVVEFWKRHNAGRTHFPDAILQSLVKQIPDLPPWERGER